MDRIRKRWMDFKQNTGQMQIIGNISFCVYYAVMVVVKVFGYVSYETFFKAAFVLALVCLLVKVLTTRYTMREFTVLYLLLAVSAVCWLRVGEKNVLFITLSFWGIKNVRFDILLRTTVWIRVAGIALMILLALTGLMDLQAGSSTATDFSERSVYAFGYIKANAAYYMVFVTIAILLYLRYEKLNFWYFLVSAAVCFWMFEHTYCRTGMIVFFGMWALIALDKISRWKKYYGLLSVTTAFLFGMSLFWMLIYRIDNPFLFRINRMLNGRIEITNNYYKAYGVTLFPKTADIFWNMNFTTIDNLYMYLFISCGAVFTLLFVFWACKSQWRLYKSGCYKEIIFFLIFAVYALLEQSPMNPVLNPFLLLTANLVYREDNVREL